MKPQSFKEFLLSSQLEPDSYRTLLVYLAHDLRSPLSGIVSGVDLLQDYLRTGEGYSIEDQERILEIIRRCAQTILKMTTDMAEVASELRDQSQSDH